MPTFKMPRFPTARQCLMAFDGRIYKPVTKNTTITDSTGSTGGYRDSIDSLQLKFHIGAANESVIVLVAKDPWHASFSNALHQLAFELDSLERPRFPVVIERGRQRIPIEGRERTFTTYTAGPIAVAVGSIDGLYLMIRCRTRRLRTLALGLIEADELKHALPRR